ncbi:wiskott-Aldrich syndrome protein homolog 1 [Sorghum bicolor]|uniref:Uncharacterized protein n=1 Tax=Sorghum bicolor TaxID=4558 RepID=A0A1B6Q9L0_SORBI|nr:wiskott-Aldrich syndrome protein homolog 1 [Sorghum bicolor]KXG34607.1 hypothetical protein SORBI_3002G066300 [Sorghum bicolor]|eukprot:XP_021310330.1 wiskott-Aldrich syndrome protein homolog 1 [Sorghum bicolor]
MELFERARTVRLRSHHDKYLYADEDEAHVVQDRNAASPNARWVVERVPHAPGVLRLRGRYGRYLSASNEPFLLGFTGRKVLQTLPHRLDSSVEWVPVRDDAGANAHARAARLRTRYGNFLRANAGLPPWRNSVTHDAPHRHAAWVVWDVEIVQALPPPTGPDSAETVDAADAASPTPSYSNNKPPSRPQSPAPLPTSALRRPPPPPAHHREENMAPFRAQPPPPPPGYIAPPAPGLYRLESTESSSVPLHKVEGRAVHYQIGDSDGEVRPDEEAQYLTFNGTSLEELLERLKEETGLHDVIMCSRSPINGKLLPLRLQLPPNNAAVHIVLVHQSSKVAKSFA